MITFALVGNPNSGLTTLFNQLTGGVLHTGFFSNADRATKEGPVKKHKGVSVIELPGTYSLSAYSKDDISNRAILTKEKPDVIINVVDASSIERNLYLTQQLMELEIPIVLALNMMDEMRKNETYIDLQKLEAALSVPIVPISAIKNEGIHDLIHSALETYETKRVPKKLDFCTGHIHTAIHSIAHLIEAPAKQAGLPLRYCATRIVEGDDLIIGELGLPPSQIDIIEHIVSEMETSLDTDREAAMADMRYAFIEALCSKAVLKQGASKEHLRSLRIDSVLTNRYLAIPIFIGIMFLVFWLTFGLVGAYFSDVFSWGIDGLTAWVDGMLSHLEINPALHSLIINGIFAGVGSVLSFLPIIAVLFFFLSICLL
jgi:ferrous iron transport protein B